MRRSHKLILASVLVAVVLIGGMAGAVLARDGGKVDGQRGAFAARVADILGIDQQELEDAFKQARTELREEALDIKFQELVAEGALTQDQADEFKAWLQEKPDVPRVRPEKMQALVEEGILTQEQVDAYREWLQSKPDIQLPRPQGTECDRMHPGRKGSGRPDGQAQGLSQAIGLTA